jgi:nucleotide-binding universal stress UspA family protein
VINGVDDSVASIRALGVAADLADRLELELDSVHVDADDSWEEAPRETPAALTVVKGEPVAVLREHAADPDTSLVVVGSRGRTSWRAPLGSVSRALAADAPVPVMVVPPTAAGASRDHSSATTSTGRPA